MKEKKASVVVRADKFDYAAVITVTGTAIRASKNQGAVITVTGTAIRASKNQGATAEELVAEMHKQFCILGGKNKEANDDDYMKEMALSANYDIECYHCGQKGHKKSCPKTMKTIWEQLR